MRKSLPARLCYALLLACFPASMLLVVWIPAPVREWISEQHPAAYEFLFEHLYPAMPSWLQYFSVQTLAAAIAICGALYLVRRGWRPSLHSLKRLGPFPLLVGGYALWSGLTCFWSAWPYGTRAYFVRELPFYFLSVAAMLTCADKERWVTAAKVFVAAAFTEAVIQGGIIIHSARSADRALRGAFTAANAVFYSNPNFSCALLLTAAFIAAAFALLVLRRLLRPGEGGQRPIVAVAQLGAAVLAICAFGLVFYAADSLAGYVALLAAVAALGVCMLPFKDRRPLVGAVALLAGGTMLVFLASEDLQTRALRSLLSPQRTTSLRIVDWLAAKELYVHRPLRGWGMGSYAALYAHVHPPVARRLPFTADLRTTHPHNEFVRVATEQGLVGLLLYVAILLYAFRVSYVRLRGQPFRTRLVGYALWAGTLTFVVQASFGKAPMGWSFSSSYWILVGILASAAHWERGILPAEREGAGQESAAPGWLAFGAVAVLVGWGWWSWAAGAHTAMVHLNQARTHQFLMGKPRQRAHTPEERGQFERFSAALARARPRLLWPDEVLHLDYVRAWWLMDDRQWARAARQLEQLQQVAPDYVESRLFLARSYLEIGDRQGAIGALEAYITRNPYNYRAYRLLARLDPGLALGVLEGNVFSRLAQPEDWIMEDPPTPGMVRELIDVYLRARMPEKGRELVGRVDEFMATAHVSGVYRFSARNQVRKLEETYLRYGESLMLRRLEAAFPDIARGAGR
jgi:O-antigen ligase